MKALTRWILLGICIASASAWAEDYDLILIGHHGHDEVTGTMGEAPGRIQLVTCAADADQIQLRNPDRLLKDYERCSPQTGPLKAAEEKRR